MARGKQGDQIRIKNPLEGSYDDDDQGSDSGTPRKADFGGTLSPRGSVKSDHFGDLTPREEVDEAASCCDKFSHFVNGHNVAAGAAAALHVNIYLFCLGMMLASPYFDVMGTTMIAVTGSMVMQFVHTVFGSYRHFVITNADTLPGAVLVEILRKVQAEIEAKWILLNSKDFDLLDTDVDGVLTRKEIEAGLTVHNKVNATVTEPVIWKHCYQDEDCWQRVHSTMVFALMFAGLITALTLVFMGRKKMGNLISFVPLTVEAAFLAGCGWKIAKTGLFFLIDKKLLLKGKQFSEVFTNAAPMIGMGVLILWAERRFHHSKYGQWTLPALLFGLTGLFYLLLLIPLGISGKSWDQVLHDVRRPTEEGIFPVLPAGGSWLMDPSDTVEPMWFPQFAPVWQHACPPGSPGTCSKPIVPANPLEVDYAAVLNFGQMVSIVILIIMTVITILLNSSAIEEETGRDIDFDLELSVTGYGNLAAAALAGPIGLSSVAKTMLCYGMGGHYYAGTFACAYYGAYWAVLFVIARWIPTQVLGAFIFAIGVELMLEWLVHIRHRIQRAEHIEICGLFLLMTLNFVVGFFFGMFMSLVVFASRYADVPVIKTVMDGSEFQGRSMRNRHDTIVLNRWGRTILTVRLQGYIFFFTAEKLRKDMMILLHERGKRAGGAEKVEYLILDFRFVEDFDTTAIKKFRKLLRFCEAQQTMCIVTNLKDGLQERMERHGVHDSTNPPIDEHGHGHDGGHGHDHHGIEPVSDAGPDVNFVALRYFEDSEDGVDWACGQVLEKRRKVSFLKRDAVSGKWTMRSVVKSLIWYQKIGLGAMVSGQLFDSPTFHAIGKLVEHNVGDVLQRQGEWSHQKLWYIVRGSCSMFHTHRDGLVSKTDTRYAGTILGELEFFLDEPRYATLQCMEDNTVLVEYDAAAYAELKLKASNLADHLYVYIISSMSNALKRQNHEINLLLQNYDDQEHTERAAPEEAIGKVELSNLEQSNTAVAVADHKTHKAVEFADGDIVGDAKAIEALKQEKATVHVEKDVVDEVDTPSATGAGAGAEAEVEGGEEADVESGAPPESMEME